jgi:hypothetical protein
MKKSETNCSKCDKEFTMGDFHVARCTGCLTIIPHVVVRRAWRKQREDNTI